MCALRYVGYESFHAPVDRAVEPIGLQRVVLVPQWIFKLPKSSFVIWSHHLPTEPIFGFFVNTTIYSMVLSLPLGLFAIRRRLRSRRGKCAHCGYDLKGVTGNSCPECGTVFRT